MASGRLITFEGPEGSGKTTHIARLAEYLAGCGVAVTLTREPGGTALGEAIRGLLQHDGAGEAPVDRAEVLLFLASRAQHVERLIRPALAAGRWVLCDRFEDSTLAYQGYGRGFGLDELRAVNAFATGGLRPDLTVLLDIAPEAGRRRLQERSAQDRIERAGDAFHARLRQGFHELARREPERFVVLDTEREAAAVAEEIREAVKRRLLSCN